MKFFNWNKNRYTIFSFKNKKWAYISYIPEVYYRKRDKSYLMQHQNKREALIIGEIFRKLHYNVTIATFDNPKECKSRKYDIIFGLEPNFETMCGKNPEALKIYYATGSYWEHQSNMIRARTDEFNKKNNTQLSYSRLVGSHNSCEIADVIFQIGSQFTISTYPTELQHKIKTINQSCNFLKQCDISIKKQLVSMKDFMWFGSSGSILKGLDLIIEYFMSHPEYQLHIVGPIDTDFIEYYQNKIVEYPNIILYGFLDPSSELFLQIAYKSCANIFPSASEGGCSGSVITLMRMGVIPIISKWAAFNEINEYGYLLKNLSTDEIENSIQWINEQSSEKIQILIEKCIAYSTVTFNLERFENEFQNLLENSIIDRDFSLCKNRNK